MPAEEVDNDGALIEGSFRDPERFAALFDRYAVELHRYVARRLDPATADDLVSEAFLIAFRDRARFATWRTSARPWMYGIVTRLIDSHRRVEARKYRALARNGVGPNEDSHEERVTSRLAAEKETRQLGVALRRLAPRDRHVLFLHVWQELRYEDVAEALGVPVGTVRSRLNRARRKLRAELDKPEVIVAREEPHYG